MINHMPFTKRIIFGCILLINVIISILIYTTLFYSPDFPEWPSTTSRNLSLYIRPQEDTAILKPKPIDHCESSPYLYIVICSSVKNRAQRNALRRTWASHENLKSFNLTVKINFLLGQSEISHDNNMLAIEADKYGDVIQEKFHDTYNNLTIKVGMLLKWANSHCNQTKYILKTDDDIFVNVRNLLSLLSLQSKSTGVLLGTLIANQIPVRYAWDRWYTPRYMYSRDVFPNFVSGTGYVMSLDVAKKIYHAAQSVPFIVLEDVYFTGICAEKAGVIPVNNSGFSFVRRRGDIFVSSDSITAHEVTPDMMFAMWNMTKYGHSNYKKPKNQ